MQHLNTSELEAGLDHIKAAPADDGAVEMIVIRPRTDEREVLETCRLTQHDGCEGDGWRQDCLAEGMEPDADTQITLMNSRCVQLLAGDRSRWPLAGDQLFVDFDLSHANLPVGQQLVVGEAILEVAAEPHTGCSKFAARYGVDAVKFVNLGEGAVLNLRGIHARVVQEGEVRTGDRVKKR